MQTGVSLVSKVGFSRCDGGLKPGNVVLTNNVHFVHNDANTPYKQPPKTCVACKSSFKLDQELDRHIRSSHLPYCVYCPYSGCNWRGPRIDELQTHYAKHLGQHEESVNLEEYLIYEVKTVLEWIKKENRDDFIRTAQNWALEFVRQKANDLGKHEWLADLGCSLEERERRAQNPRSRPKSRKKNDEIPFAGY